VEKCEQHGIGIRYEQNVKKGRAKTFEDSDVNDKINYSLQLTSTSTLRHNDKFIIVKGQH
jgi:hypothetical protein